MRLNVKFFKSLKIIVFTFEHKTFMLLFYTKIEVHLVVHCGYFYNISAIRSLYGDILHSKQNQF
jgi:hypothetical protein